MALSISNQQTPYNTNSEISNVLKIVSNQVSGKNKIRKLIPETVSLSLYLNPNKGYKLNSPNYIYPTLPNYKTALNNEIRDIHLKSNNEFLIKLYYTLEPLISDANLSVESICTLMCISKTKLFMKLKTLTGLSITHYMRNLRLTKAKKLLSQTEMTISEIAYTVGFNDPKYFTRVFGEEFGMSPKEVRLQWKYNDI